MLSTFESVTASMVKTHTKDELYWGGQVIASQDNCRIENGDPQRRWYTSDHLGSTRLVTDDSRFIVSLR